MYIVTYLIALGILICMLTGKYIWYFSVFSDGEGLYYFGARYLDPDIGTFTSTDPMGQFWNSYSYGGCNPIIGVDPDGMEYYVSNTGEQLYGPPLSYEDQSVFDGYDGPIIGELGGTIDISTIFSNLLDQNIGIAENILSL